MEYPCAECGSGTEDWTLCESCWDDGLYDAEFQRLYRNHLWRNGKLLAALAVGAFMIFVGSFITLKRKMRNGSS